MYARAATWWTILRIALAERLVYRGDFALGTLMRFLPIITQIFLWYAIFQARDQEPLADYTYRDFVAYYLLTMVARAFSSMPGLASGIAGQIRSGEIKKFLIQPIDLLGFLLLGRIAHKLAYYAVAVVPFALVFFLCRDFFPGWPSTTAWSAGILSLILCFLLRPAWASWAFGGWRSAHSCLCTCSSASSSRGTCFHSTCCRNHGRRW
jgi:ABC-2 type transport system permease protein